MLPVLSPTYDKSTIPAHWYSAYPNLVALVDLYFKWSASQVPADIVEQYNLDTSTSLDQLVKDATGEFPVVKQIDRQLVIQHASDVFKAKGTVAGIETLFQLFLKAEAKVLLPGDYVFTPSADQTIVQYQIELANGSVLPIGKRLTTSSGGSFVVATIDTIPVNGSFRTVATITDIVQPINQHDYVEGIRIEDSLDRVVLQNVYSDAIQGEPVTIVGDGVATGYVATVNSIDDQFVVNIDNGGSQYTANAVITVSDTVLTFANTVPTTNTSILQTLYQVSPSVPFAASQGSTITLTGPSSSVTANVVASVANANTGGDLIVYSSSPAANLTSANAITQGSNTAPATVANKTATGSIIAFDDKSIGIVTANNQLFANGPVQIGSANATPIAKASFKNIHTNLTEIQAVIPQLLSANTGISVGGGIYAVYNTGTIGSVSIKFDTSANTRPYITVSQTGVSGTPSQYTIQVLASGDYVGGETVTCYSNPANTVSVQLGNTFNYSVGDVLLSPNTTNAVWGGVIVAKEGSIVDLASVKGTPAAGVQCTKSGGGSFTSVDQIISRPIPTGKGRIVAISGNSLSIKVTGGIFSAPGTIMGNVSRASQPIQSLVQTSSLGGSNANIGGYVVQSQTVANSVYVSSSGGGFNRPTSVSVLNGSGKIIATGFAITAPIGKSETITQIQKSGLSQQTKLQDSFYRQQFAYDIQSPLSFDSYAGVIDRYVHVSGTKMFGSVELKHSHSLNSKIKSSVVVS